MIDFENDIIFFKGDIIYSESHKGESNILKMYANQDSAQLINYGLNLEKYKFYS